MEKVLPVLDNYTVVNNGIKHVKKFLEKNADIEGKDQYGKTLLQYAIEFKNKEIIELLLKRGADPNTKDNYGRMPLHFAIIFCDINVAQMLVDKGADIAGEDGYGRVPLHYAIELNKQRIINLLLTKGANVNISFNKDNRPVCGLIRKAYRDCRCEYINPSTQLMNLFNKEDWEGDGYTALYWAVEQGNTLLVKTLLNHNASVNSNTKNSIPLYIAVKYEHVTVVQQLLEHGANVDTQNINNETVLYFAVSIGNLRIVKYILQYHPDVNNKSNKNSLNLAICLSDISGYNKIVKILCRYGFTLNFENANYQELMRLAIKKSYLTVIEDLLKHGVDVNMKFCNRKFWIINELTTTLDTPLHNAVIYKQVKTTLLLLNYKANVNLKDTSKKTPIFYAVQNGDLNLIKLLFSNGANIKNCPELIGVAVEQKRMEIVEILLQYGANINGSDIYGMTALHFTSFRKCDEKIYRTVKVNFSNIEFRETYSENDDNIHVDIAKFLISKGANVTAKSKYHATTLHGACLNGYVKIVKTLLEYNVNVNSKMVNGITPLHFSVYHENAVITTMLLNKGANVNAKALGFTALHIATLLKHQFTVELLLRHGARTDFKVRKGVTPLHIAAKNNDLETVEILLKYNADATSTDKCGKTPLYYAAQEGNLNIIMALLYFDFNIDFESVFKCIENLQINPMYTLFQIQLNSFNTSIYERTLYILIDYKIKLQSIGKSSLQNNSIEDDRMKKFRNECEEEVKRMKCENIINNVSFFDILVMHLNQLIRYARNESIVQVVQSYNYKIKFPIYADMIMARFKIGLERKELLDQINSSNLYFLFNEMPTTLPCICVEKILSYLSNEDLKILKYV